MSSLTLADVIEGLTGNRIEARQGINNVVIDSRQAKAGSLFVALTGERTDGHNFVEQAFQNGAVAAIIHQPIGSLTEGRTIKAERIDTEQMTSIANDPPVCIQVKESLTGLQTLAAYWRSKFSPRVIGITGSVGKSTTKELVWAVLSTRFNTLKSEGNYNNEIGLPLTLLKYAKAPRI